MHNKYSMFMSVKDVSTKDIKSKLAAQAVGEIDQKNAIRYILFNICDRVQTQNFFYRALK